MLICSLQLQPSVNTPHLLSTAVTSLLDQEYTDELHPLSGVNTEC